MERERGISDIWCNLLYYSLLPAVFVVVRVLEVECQFNCNETQEDIDHQTHHEGYTSVIITYLIISTFSQRIISGEFVFGFS